MWSLAISKALRLPQNLVCVKERGSVPLSGVSVG